MASYPDTDFINISERVKDLRKKLIHFVENECIPAERIYEKQLGTGESRWKTQPAIMETLKSNARSLGLWNLFLPKQYPEGAGLTNLEYSVLAEIMGRSPKIAPEACNCAAPDTGNMEVFAKYGTQAQKDKWLKPLLNGTIRSAFAMTEKNIASSDATNIETSIVRQGNHYVINGHKWYISGAGHPNCSVYLILGKTDSNNANVHKQQSIVIVPADTPGIQLIKPGMVFGYDDANHGHFEIIFKDVKVPVENIILGEGRGFEVIQGRLGPGRIHHCCRTLGMAERGLDLMLARVTQRKTFGKYLAEHGTIKYDIAQSRMEIDQARLLVWKAADMIDKVGAKRALKEIGMIKVVVPNMALKVLDRAIQAFGAAGVSQDFVLAEFYAGIRTLRIADGPDEVHTQQIGKLELRRAKALWKANL
ncbi:acyl-CoA dehydrogenase/oxidase [Paraphysoderma sedebokerense]|nr:acyl-CoA dehydrogenase/oxidase [Paraphysoderma sedebokerense]